MKIHSSLGAWLMLILIVNANAQRPPQKNADLEILADEIFGLQDTDLDYQALYETMAHLLTNQIDLNTASPEELRFLNLLTEQQVQSLVEYRSENGHLLSIYELQAVPGFDLSIIHRIIPFVRIGENNGAGLWKRVVSEPNGYFIIRADRTLETRRGFKNSEPSGNQFHGKDGDLYIRFRTSKPGDFSFGFTAEKDAGEEIRWSRAARQYGPDFLSAHGQVMNKGRIKNFIVGDYQTQFGQGLLLGGSFGYGKGSEAVTTVRRSNLGFLPYTSAGESGYKRGGAMTLQVARAVHISAFYSNVLLDATPASDTLGNAFVSSFQTTGLHRNDNEINNRHAVREQNAGSVLNIRKGPVDAGVIANTITYNIPVSRNPQPYNQFAFSGSGFTNAGVFLNYTLHNVTFFSEAAKTLQHGYGFMAGILTSLTAKLDVALHVRNYQRDFYSPYGNAFGENTTPQNESGAYWGLKYRWSKRFSVSGYADLFRFPWLRFRSYAPSAGHEWLVRFNYQPSRHVLIFFQGREESKVRNASDDRNNLYAVVTGVKRNYWINLDYPLSDNVKMKTRAQFSTYRYSHATSRGMVIMQDITATLGKVALTARYALFDTDDYDNRQYSYERDVWLAFAMPAYAGTGIRTYFVAEYSINRKITLWLRYGHVRYTDRSEIGSGMDVIAGKEKNDLRIQVRVKILN